MLVGMPSALRIYHGLDVEEEECPLTVRDGRNVSGKELPATEIRHFETEANEMLFPKRMRPFGHAHEGYLLPV